MENSSCKLASPRICASKSLSAGSGEQKPPEVLKGSIDDLWPPCFGDDVYLTTFPTVTIKCLKILESGPEIRKEILTTYELISDPFYFPAARSDGPFAGHLLPVLSTFNIPFKNNNV